MDKETRTILQSLFGKVKQVLYKGNKVEVIKTEMIDGISAEIAYVSQIDAWNIASGNCSVVAGRREDINQYRGEFKKDNMIFEVVEEWFNEL